MPENNKRGMHGYFFFLLFISITFSLSLSLKGPLPEKQALNFTSINSSCRVLPLWIDGKRICCNMTSVAALFCHRLRHFVSLGPLQVHQLFF